MKILDTNDYYRISEFLNNLIDFVTYTLSIKGGTHKYTAVMTFTIASQGFRNI